VHVLSDICYDILLSNVALVCIVLLFASVFVSVDLVKVITLSFLVEISAVRTAYFVNISC